MRLLVLSTELPPGPGGIGSHAHQLTSELVRLGWQATVMGPQDYVTPARARRWQEQQSFQTRRLRHWPGSPIQGSIWGARLAREIIRQRPRCLLATGQRATWLAASVAPLFRLPWLAVVHGTELVSPRQWQRRLTRWALERAGAVVSVSEYTRGLMMGEGIRPRLERVIHNGADADAFSAPPKAEDFPADQLPAELAPSGPGTRRSRLLLTVGRVGRRKGHDLVVRVLPRIRERIGDVHYVAVGLPELGEEITALARAEGVSDRVHLTGRLEAPAVRALLHAADLFVMPSRRTVDGDVEGFGIAVVEAALCGLPSVVTEGSGLVEAIVPGKTGLAVSPEDPEALAKAIIELLVDEPRRQKMARRARDRAWAEQTWANRVSEYDSMLRALRESGESGEPGERDGRGKS